MLLFVASRGASATSPSSGFGFTFAVLTENITFAALTENITFAALTENITFAAFTENITFDLYFCSFEWKIFSENLTVLRNGNYFGAFGTRTSRNNEW